jgi:transcriptional accessory protein Tex/SPT6
MSKRFIRHPSEIVRAGDNVQVWIADVDLENHKIGLSMLPVAHISAT